MLVISHGRFTCPPFREHLVVTHDEPGSYPRSLSPRDTRRLSGREETTDSVCVFSGLKGEIRVKSLKLARTGFVLSVAAVLVVPAVVPSVAQASGDLWTYSGSLSAPPRSVGQVDITVSGTVTASETLLQSVASTTNCVLPEIPQVTPFLQNTTTSAISPITNGGLLPPVITDTTPTPVTGSATVDPGTYALVLRFRCSDSNSWSGNIEATPTQRVSIASLTSTTRITLACLATSPPSECTATKPQVTAVPSGTSVTFGAVLRRLWSDGVTTNEPVTGSQTLQRALPSSSSFATISNSTCAYTTDIDFSYQYRCQAAGSDFTPVTVTALTRTFDYVVPTPVLTPSFAVMGSPVTVSGTIQERYSDGSLWPALASTTYSVEFRASGSTSWRTIVSSRALNAPGSYSATFTMSGEGSVRVVRGSDVSTSVELKELVPSETYQLGTLALPAEVAPRQSVPMRATVRAQFSDGSFRDAPDGTDVTLEFASSFDPAASTDLTWRAVEQGTTTAGSAMFNVIPQASGFWRIRVGSTSSNSSYLKVTGSAPIQVTASMSPAPGERPFVGSTSRYTVSAQLSGYVGSEPATLFIDLGAGFERVAAFNTAGTISGVFPIRAGQQSGSVTPKFEVRTASSQVLAQTTSAPIVIDGVKTYVVTTVTGTKPVREGASARVTATLSGVSNQGVQVAVNWNGEVRVQRKAGRKWVTVSRQQQTSGARVSLNFTVAARGQYRVFWVPERVASKPFSLNVITATNVFQFTRMSASRGRVEAGERSELSVRVRQQFSNKRFYPAPDGSRVTLQAFVNNTWTKQRDVTVSRGVAKISIRPGGTRTYRFVTASGLASPTATITVVPAQPSRLVVDWPSRYYADEGARFTVYVRTSSGGVWSGTTTLQLQYRFSSSASWRTLDTKTYRGSRLSWGWGSGTYGTIYFRVIAPSLGLSSSQAYS